MSWLLVAALVSRVDVSGSPDARLSVRLIPGATQQADVGVCLPTICTGYVMYVRGRFLLMLYRALQCT